jgi:hypothetical protein
MTPDDLQRAGVRVRKLEWVAEGSGAEAETSLFGDYRVLKTSHRSYPDKFDVWISGRYMVDGGCHTLTDAKAAAQQDYENRILSALEPIHE